MSEPEVRENGLKAFETLSQFLDKDGWYPQRLDEKYIFRMGFNGKNGQLTCFAQIRVDLEQLIIYAVAPVKVPEETRVAIAEYITRANYGLRIGNLEMDFNDGEIRYKSSLDFEGETLTPQFIKMAIYPAVQTLDHYLPGLMTVIYGGKSPEEAVAEVEGGNQ
jgi:hypothetical protein